jgi:hypothetical protein
MDPDLRPRRSPSAAQIRKLVKSRIAGNARFAEDGLIGARLRFLAGPDSTEP